MARKKQPLSESDILKQTIVKNMKGSERITFTYKDVELRLFFSYRKSNTYGNCSTFSIHLPYSGCNQLITYKIARFKDKPDEIQWFTFTIGEDKIIADKAKSEADYICEIYNLCLEALGVDCLVSHRIKDGERGFVFTNKSSGKSKFVGDRPRETDFAKIK